MTAHDQAIDPVDAVPPLSTNCLERRKTNRLWACNIARWNAELDKNPSQCSQTNVRARGAFKLLATLSPDCVACRYL